MRILYVAKHNSGDNDDEGAIAHGLRLLGHEVICVPEQAPRAAFTAKADFLLFHKWAKPDEVRRVRLPRVFWYFDLVDFSDPTVAGRCRDRMKWMAQMTPLVRLGCCTDGDWVNRDKTGKLVRLLQGADERYTGPGTPGVPGVPPILFTGSPAGGLARSSHVRELQARYGERFGVLDRPHRKHGRELADVLATAAIAVAPDGPITDHYWSNRVYLTIGLGGFLAHPYAATLTEHYKHGEGLVYYRTRTELNELIDHYLEHPVERAQIQQAGLRRTLQEHTYRHRCARLIELVKERVL